MHLKHVMNIYVCHTMGHLGIIQFQHLLEYNVHCTLHGFQSCWVPSQCQQEGCLCVFWTTCFICHLHVNVLQVNNLDTQFLNFQHIRTPFYQILAKTLGAMSESLENINCFTVFGCFPIALHTNDVTLAQTTRMSDKHSTTQAVKRSTVCTHKLNTKIGH